MDITLRRRGVSTANTDGAPLHLGRLMFLGGELLVVALAALLLILVKRHLGPLPGDVGVSDGIQHSLLHTVVAGPIEAVSTLGWPIPAAISVAVMAAVLLVPRRWLDALIIIPLAVITSLSNLITADWVRRPRPEGHGVKVLQHVTRYYSFPSGHVVFVTAIWGFIVYLTFHSRHRSAAWMWAPRLVGLLFVIVMPISRVLEGEHWPSDVIEGLLYGFFWLLAAIFIHGWIATHFPRLLSKDERTTSSPRR